MQSDRLRLCIAYVRLAAALWELHKGCPESIAGILAHVEDEIRRAGKERAARYRALTNGKAKT